MRDELSPEAQQLLRAGRDADLPSADDRARVRTRLAAQLAGVAAASAVGKASAHTVAGTKLAGASIAAKTLWTVAVVGLVGAGASVLLPVRDAPMREPGSVTAAVPKSAPSTATVAAPHEAPDVAATRPTGPSTNHAAPPAPGAASPGHAERIARVHTERPAPRAADSDDWAADLQAEVALLSHAQRALAAGDPNGALQHLDQHQAKYPAGALSQERRAATAIAHCQASRLARGRALLNQLPDDSPLSARAHEACREPEP